jgi:CMP-N-acetylneuraminic acid synthetase
MVEIPEEWAIDIDTTKDFQLAELLLREGMIRFPWL